VAVVAAGWLLPELVSAIPIGAGLLTLVAAVLLPAVKEIEFGLSPGFKLSPALKDREAELRSVFELQKGDLEYCAHLLLCRNPEAARELLEAAWSQAAAAWRGPVTPQLRVYTLCVLVRLLRKHEEWTRPLHGDGTHGDGTPLPVATDVLASLGIDERVVVVLHEFANLSFAEIAGITGMAMADVLGSWAAAHALTRGPAPEGKRALEESPAPDEGPQ
jgi:DNA-directed RNA polymerase specialized sigma24 family protein